MTVDIEINDLSGCGIDKKKLKLIIEKTIGIVMGLKIKKRFAVSVGLVLPEEIKKINNEYRQKNHPTDILSFANYKNKNEILKNEKNKIFLGELIICCKDIEDYSKKRGILFEKELAKVISHGTLHLLGFKHSKNMFKIQDEVAGFLVKE